MHKPALPLRAACLAAFLLISACKQAPETIALPDDQKAELAKAKPVELPPAIKSTKTYRCKDNSVVYVTFMTDDLTALVRDKEEEPPISTLKAPAVGQPFTSGGYSLSGSGNTVTYTSPDSGTLSCHV